MLSKINTKFSLPSRRSSSSSLSWKSAIKYKNSSFFFFDFRFFSNFRSTIVSSALDLPWNKNNSPPIIPTLEKKPVSIPAAKSTKPFAPTTTSSEALSTPPQQRRQSAPNTNPSTLSTPVAAASASAAKSTKPFAPTTTNSAAPPTSTSHPPSSPSSPQQQTPVAHTINLLEILEKERKSQKQNRLERKKNRLLALAAQDLASQTNADNNNNNNSKHSSGSSDTEFAESDAKNRDDEEMKLMLREEAEAAANSAEKQLSHAEQMSFIEQLYTLYSNRDYSQIEIDFRTRFPQFCTPEARTDPQYFIRKTREELEPIPYTSIWIYRINAAAKVRNIKLLERLTFGAGRTLDDYYNSSSSSQNNTTQQIHDLSEMFPESRVLHLPNLVHYKRQVINLLIRAYCLNGDIELAEKLLRFLETKLRLPPSIFTLIPLIDFYIDHAKRPSDSPAKLAKIMEKIASLGLESTAGFTVSMFKIARKLGDHKMAMRVYETARNRNLALDDYCFNDIIYILLKQDNVAAALKVLEDMKSLGIAPDNSTFASFLSYFASTRVRQFRNQIEVTNHIEDDAIYKTTKMTTLRQMEESAESLAQAQKNLASIMSYMNEFGFKPNIVHYTALVSALVKTGEIEKAKELINKIHFEDKLRIENQSLLAPLHGYYTWRGKLLEAKQLLIDMVDVYNVSPTEKLYAITIEQMLKEKDRDSLINHALDLYDLMMASAEMEINESKNKNKNENSEELPQRKARHAKPSPVIFGILGTYYSRNLDPDAIEELIEDMRAIGLKPDQIMHNLLLRAKLGRFAHDYKTYFDMQTKNEQTNVFEMEQAAERARGHDNVDAIAEVDRIFETLEKDNTDLNFELLQTMILYLCRFNCAERAIELMSPQFIRERARPNEQAILEQMPNMDIATAVSKAAVVLLKANSDEPGSWVSTLMLFAKMLDAVKESKLPQKISASNKMFFEQIESHLAFCIGEFKKWREQNRSDAYFKKFATGLRIKMQDIIYQQQLYHKKGKEQLRQASKEGKKVID